jgi:DNA-binding NarL/FixJ family response regulator
MNREASEHPAAAPRADRADQDLDFRFGGFDVLIPSRVEHVLLVSSLYESFILEEDGLVAELITSEYVDMKLSNPPRVSRVSTPSEALDCVRRENIDLVITMTRLGKWNVSDFAKAVHDIHPKLPVVVLAGDTRELARHAEGTNRQHISRFFVWNGDSSILLAIIKLIEDEMNAEHDARVGNVRIIILIENSVRFYSQYLPLIYTELVKQTQALMEQGIHRMQRLLRLRARPKILLAENYEEAWLHYTKFKQNILGIISDIRFPRGGVLDPEAGLEFARQIIKESPDIPILLQSSDEAQAAQANSMGLGFLNKRSRSLMQDLRGFIQGSMGFGDFVFNYPNGTFVGRASDLRSFEAMVRTVPDECLVYHASHNHFSNWFMARTEFELAGRIRPKRITDFHSVRDMRQYLLDQLVDLQKSTHSGVVTDFSAKHFDDQTMTFTRIGGGSMGGKARGLAFMGALLRKYRLHDHFPDVHIAVPTSAILGTDVFDVFMEKNHLYEVVARDPEDEEVSRAFLKAKIPRNAHRKLQAFARLVRYPLAVRSSSLLEDSHEESFAGVYTTHMLPNNHDDDSLRLEQLCAAIKLVYASVFYRNARDYLDATAHHVEGEKMGVLLQEIVGSRYGEHFYPTFAGVARSFNFYPGPRMTPEEGVAEVALGLGKFVVEGGQALIFSPGHPQALPQFASTRAMLSNSQRHFYALDISHPEVYPSADSNANLVKLGLDVAEKDGALAPIGSVYSTENDMVYDSLSHQGPRLVTFAHVLKSKVFPLTEILKSLLEMGSEAMGGPIEIEYAVDMSRRPMRFAFLQIRPAVGVEVAQASEISPEDERQAVCWSPEAMGNGRIDDICDVVYVKPEAFNPLHTRQIAADIARINEELKRKSRSYVLIGPGRWGSADRFLGIPVTWPQITSARVIVETTLNNFIVAPSQGTHFFQNLATFRVAYFTINLQSGDGGIDWNWLQAQPAICETEYVRHITLPRPVLVKVDGRNRRGAVLKP